MLILTRRPGETVMIGQDVSVTVLGVRRDQVRLGIDAPQHIAVHRHEVYKRILKELSAEQSEDASAEQSEHAMDTEASTK